MRSRFEEALKSRNITFLKNAKTSELCTFRIGGTADYLIEPRCIGELIGAVSLCVSEGIPYEIIGRGSNLLFGDGHLPLALIRTTNLSGVRREGGDVIADCGVGMPRLARRVAEWGFSDLAFACGIPGTLGGGATMNAGAHDGALGSHVKWAKVLFPKTGKITTLFNEELSYSYRNSVFQRENIIILQICVALQCREDPRAVKEKMKAYLARRAATQPLALPSAGSVFRRRESGESLGQILDELGLKGMRCGHAAVSEKHAGFIVNLGGATAADVQTLIAAIKRIVKRKRGFEPFVEIQTITGEGRT